MDAAQRRYSTFVHKDGAYTFRTPLAPGTYKVILETAPDKKAAVAIPERYLQEDRTPLEIRVTTGANRVDLKLTD